MVLVGILQRPWKFSKINKEKLGRVLGPLYNEGEMAQAAFTSKAAVVPQYTMCEISSSELHQDLEGERVDMDEQSKLNLGVECCFLQSLKFQILYFTMMILSQTHFTSHIKMI